MTQSRSFGTARLLHRGKSELRRVLRPLLHNSDAMRLDPALWDLAPEGERGLCMEGLALHELLAKYGSPLHVVSGQRLARNAADFRRPSPEGGRACEVYYSYKTNPVGGVLRFLHEREVGAEVISPYELWLAFQLGVPPHKIIYNGPAKSDDSLREAIAREILLINFNHREEIARVAAIASALGKRPAVGVRISASGGWSGQFGVPIEGGHALRAFEEARAHACLNVVALHAHRGILIRTLDELHGFVDQVLAFAEELWTKLGIELSMLDLGGSLAIPTVAPLGGSERRLNRTFQRPIPPPRPSSTLSIDSYARAISQRVHAHYSRVGRRVPRIFLEPGRALTGNTQILLSSVITTKASAEGVPFAVLDAGINLAESVQHEYHQLFPVNRYGSPAEQVYALAGPICSPGDVIYPAQALPRLEPGDSLAIMDSGAYLVPFSTSFSFPQPAIVMVENGRDRLLRRAERFEDVASRDRG